MDKLSYALGLGIGRQLLDMGAQKLDIDDFAQAIKDMIAGKKPEIGDQEAQTLVQTFFQEQEKQQRAAAAKAKSSAVTTPRASCMQLSLSCGNRAARATSPAVAIPPYAPLALTRSPFGRPSDTRLNTLTSST